MSEQGESFCDPSPPDTAALLQPDGGGDENKAPPHQNRNMLVLSLMFVIYMCAFTAQLTASSLAAKELGHDALATLPLAATFAGQVVSVVPFSWLQRKSGRARGFALGGLVAVGSGGLGWVAMHWRSFPLLCVAGALLGCFGGAAQFIRYAAVEVSSKAFQARALSWVMSGGAVLSVVGPEVATIAHAIGGYAALYAAIGGCGLLFALTTLLLRIPVAATSPDEEEEEDGRPLSTILCNADTATAILGCFSAYWGMVLVMTGTPVHMKDVHFGLARTANTIQIHLVGMFLPGFGTGPLIDKVGMRPVLIAGALLYSGTVAVLRNATTLDKLMPGLGMLGIAWNFCYVSSSKMLVSVPMGRREASRVQAANELLTACGDTSASLLAAVIIHKVSWNAMLWFCAPPMLLTAVLASVVGLRRRCVGAGTDGAAGTGGDDYATDRPVPDAVETKSHASRHTRVSVCSHGAQSAVGTFVSQHSLA
eukprot:TRINITY_DN8958_c0_g2_i1.p1 TRINITY_DN8958_c0_g2~~TRINITY_DN8958_c0_g2_i1.p1  ORF type:complete len:509 (+),score=165.87 TRINITY_DN8958_c0_g2_i1:90-1529(+)